MLQSTTTYSSPPGKLRLMLLKSDRCKILTSDLDE